MPHSNSMSFVDELTILARAGKGGDGVVRWLHLKGKEYSGAAGGNGGNGGNVYIRGVRDVNLLSRYRGEKRFEADAGNDGENQNKAGKSGKDMVVDLPIGSVVTNKETREVHELMEEGQRILILKGGRGGAGNAVFKSSVNQTPEESTPGAPGEEAQFAHRIAAHRRRGAHRLAERGEVIAPERPDGRGGKSGLIRLHDA